jgi:hypothetical protein
MADLGLRIHVRIANPQSAIIHPRFMGSADPPLSQVAKAQIPQDLVEPGEELALGIELVIVLVGPKKRLLGQLQGIFAVADQTQGGQIGTFHVLLDKGFEVILRPDVGAAKLY